jgi:spermidine/putrescine transport system ATP-binding protein/putrescine transport system ATP-binding protein
MNAISGAQRVRIEHVSKSFARVTAVDDVSLDLAGGEFFSLLGPSGCGKTTLLRMLAGFERPTGGRIWIGGVDVTDLPPDRRPTNLVFQSYALFPHLDVAANIAYGLRRERLSREAHAARVAAAIGLVRLDGMEHRRPDQLSGGQRQRVALARALAKRPRVLLLDEPLSALDKKLRETMQQELRALQRQVGITFIFVTHDQDEAFAMSDRIAVMDRGQVLQVATPADLYRRPSCRQVASFVGAINLFPGKVAGVSGRSLAIDAGPLGVIPAPLQREEIAAGAAVTLAVRPEQIGIRTDAAQSAGAIPGRVLTTTFLGDRTFVNVLVDGLPAPVLVSAAGMAEVDMLAPDQRVWLAFNQQTVVIAS